MKTPNIICIILLLFTTYLSDNQAEEYAQTGLPDGAYARLGKGNINVMRFTPDGTHLAVGTDAALLIYAIESRAETILSVGEKMKNQILAFTPNGKILACTGKSEFVIKFWDWKNSKQLKNLTVTHKFLGIADLCFEDDKTLIILSSNGHIRKWNINSSQEISRTQFNNTKSEKVISHDGSIYVSGGPAQGRIRIWNISQGKLGSELTVKQDGIIQKSIKSLFNSDDKNGKIKKGIHRIAISPDKKQVVSYHTDNIVRLWDTNSKNQKILFRLQSSYVNALTFSFDNRFLAIGKTDKIILIWDLINRRSHTILKGHRKSVIALAFSSNKDGLIASGSSDGTIRLWNSISGVERGIIAIGYSDSIKTLAFTTDNNTLYTATESGLVQHWHAKTGRKIGTPFYSEEDCFIAVTFSHDMKYLAYQGGRKVSSISNGGYDLRLNEEGIRLWYIPAWKEKLTIPNTPLSLTYSPDNRFIATPSFPDGIVLWDVNTGEKSMEFHPEKGRFRIPLFSPNGVLLVQYGSRDPIEAWNLISQEKIPVANNNDLYSISFSPDSKLLAAKDSNGIVLFDVAPNEITYRTSLTPKDNRGSGKSLLFSPDVKTLLESRSSGQNHNIRLWDVESKTEIGSITGHVNYIQTMTFSHNGKILASGSMDGTILLWNWEEIMTQLRKEE